MILRDSKEHLLSREGVTQGDPISMFMYAIGSLPLILLLKDIINYIQIWFEDDSCAGGKLCALREWFDKLSVYSPLFGYFPEPAKSHLIVNESNLDIAKDVFNGTGINVVTNGKFLGASVGDRGGL
jgi:hypothetical protein